MGAAVGAAAGSRAGAGQLAGYISNDDYPIEAMRRGEQGRVGFELEISPEGRGDLPRPVVQRQPSA